LPLGNALEHYPDLHYKDKIISSIYCVEVILQKVLTLINKGMRG